MLHRLALSLVLAGLLHGQAFFPVEDVRAGQRAVGRTVFSGTEVAEFDIEILGVLENFSGPKTAIIFGRLSGGPLARTGVMAGMSGSPVYIDGRLAGAVAFMYPFSTEPLAGIRPIGEMVAGLEGPVRAAAPAAADPLDDWRELAGLPGRATEAPEMPQGRFVPIATPVALSGFSERTFEVFASKFERLGLRPLQGAGGALREDPGGPPEPGSMISVGLIRGDLNFAASGTVTHVDGKRLFAFGHRFLSAGDTKMPLMRASVMALVPNLSASFKLSGTGPLIGTISMDRQAGIAGELGDGPPMVPCSVSVRTGSGVAKYAFEMVRDDQLTPFLLQVALFSAIDLTERSLGPLTIRVRGGVEFSNGLPRLVLDDIYSGTGGVAQAAALSTAVPLSYLLQTGHSGIEVASIDMDVEAVPAGQYSDLVRAWVSKDQVRPGETVEIRVAVKGPDGLEEIRSLVYDVPVSLPAGAVEVTVGDAFTANLQQWRGLLAGRKVRDAAATIRFLNDLRGSDSAYLRVWRRQRALWLHSDKLPVPPASLHAVLSTVAGRGTGALADLSSTLAERRIDRLGGVVRGRLGLRFVVTGS